MERDWNLLFGILAVRLKKIAPSQLVKAAAAWIEDPAQDVPERLSETEALTQADREAVERLVQAAVDANGGDLAATLALFGGEEQIYECYRGTVVLSESRGVRSAIPPEAAGFSDMDSVPAVQESPGRYTHVTEYARGGMGRVLLVEDKHLGREVAWKELLPLQGSEVDREEPHAVRMSMSLVSRFLQEARITGQLEHPSIVPVYELGRRTDGSLYYTMKLVRGETLQKRIRECTSLAERLNLLPHFMDLCQALAYAHSRGVIHRDIKPANVMVGEFGETVVLDWGLATAKADRRGPSTEDVPAFTNSAGHDDSWRTQYGSALGTPCYMPPEQAKGQLDQIDERSDVYSLGAVLYELLAGRPPFDELKSEHILDRVITSDPTPVCTLQPNAPPELVAICERAMQKDPTKRYVSAKALADEVSRFQSGALVRAYEYGLWSYLRKFVVRHKALMAVSTLALATIAGMSTYYALHIVTTNRELRAANEVAITSLLQSIADAERQFQEGNYQDYDGDGVGDYGTLMQLSMADRSGILSRYVDAFEDGSHLGYALHLEVTPGTATEAPAFTCLAAPAVAGRAGTDSFIVDETGSVRTASGSERLRLQATNLQSVKLLHYLGPPVSVELNRVAVDFHHEQPEYDVEPVYLGFEAFAGNVANTLERDPSPDLITYWPGAKIRPLVDGGLLLPIEDVWEKAGLTNRVSADIRNVSSQDGRAYLLPFVRNFFVFYYNKALFDSHGLEPPATWDAFLDTCRVLAADGVTPVALAARDKFPYYFWFDYLLLRTAGRAYRDALAAGSARYTDPEVDRVFEILSQLFASGYVSAQAAEAREWDAFQLLLSGQAAMTLTGTWIGPFLESNGWEAGEHFGLFPFPTLDAQGSADVVGNLDAVALSARAARPSVARAFLEHLARQDAQLRLSKAAGGLPLENQPEDAALSELQRAVEACVSPAPAWALAYDLSVTQPEALQAFANRVGRFTRAPENYRQLLQDMQSEIDDAAAGG